MSKIRQALVEAAGLSKNRSEAEEDFLRRVVTAVGGEITDEVWAAIPGDAQDWNNVAADAIMKAQTQKLRSKTRIGLNQGRDGRTGLLQYVVGQSIC